MSTNGSNVLLPPLSERGMACVSERGCARCAEAKDGDVTGSRPGMLYWESRSKYDAWSEERSA